MHQPEVFLTICIEMPLILFIKIRILPITRKLYRDWKHNLSIWQRQKNSFLWNTMPLKMLMHGKKSRMY